MSRLDTHTVSEKHLERFFNYACKRYNILLNRRAGLPVPWTDDPVLSAWRFTNVFREDDKTTTWFRDNVRDKMRRSPAVMMATIAFRAFNRIETGELLKDDLVSQNWDFAAWKEKLEARRAAGFPTITGSYIIRTPHGMNKIDGVLWTLREAKLREAALLHWHWHTPFAQRSQQSFWLVLREFPYLGDFTAAEVVCDLIHTDILEMANDLMTWTNPGPGCAAGLGMLLHGNSKAFDRHSRDDREVMMRIMARFLEASRPGYGYWPEEWPEWNLHTVEFCMCEMSKYIRGLAGLKLKRKYKHGMAHAEPLHN